VPGHKRLQADLLQANFNPPFRLGADDKSHPGSVRNK
jgi:hypothetical protein